ncbi:SigE family RNA polymerase sigma factor [Plantactinospora sp. GCM10030261]|uniref:SigE family RNA polymerase sigma factor n=1 Tax=Plantactinospora sp. GCM10030261 TaxID=3273420 RepID=UPI0036163147
MDVDTRRDFTAFVEARSHALFRTALALTGHRQQAEDLLQTVLARAYRNWGNVRHGHPEAYLRRALYREQVSWWRRPIRRREVVTDRLPDRAGTDLTDRVDLNLALRASLDRLAPKQRAVLVLRYLEGLPDGEIAEILNCKPATVRSQAARALDRLRAHCPDLDHLVSQEAHR